MCLYSCVKRQCLRRLKSLFQLFSIINYFQIAIKFYKFVGEPIMLRTIEIVVHNFQVSIRNAIVLFDVYSNWVYNGRFFCNVELGISILAYSRVPHPYALQVNVFSYFFFAYETCVCFFNASLMVSFHVKFPVACVLKF